MTPRELNRDIKKFGQEVYSRSFGNVHEFTAYLQGEAKAEFTRLYNADADFSSVSKENVLLMLRLNLAYRFIPLHTFGIAIKYSNFI